MIAEIKPLFPVGQPAYLVGGSVRDLLLGRTVHDLDIALPGETRRTARRIAKKLKAGFFLLDDARDTSRVLYRTQDGAAFMLDFVVLAENDLVTDLERRDFTINAMAIDLDRPEQLIDPCRGQEHLQARILRTCTPASLPVDPLRILRGIRLAVDLELHIDPATWQEMHASLPQLPQISPERVRDELLRMLEGSRPADALRQLEELGSFPYILPELVALKGLPQTAPHVLDAWEHTLAAMQALEKLLDVLTAEGEAAPVAEPWVRAALVHLGNFRQNFRGLIAQPVTPGRSRRGLLLLAALFHDVAKPAVQIRDADGRLRAFGHEASGADWAAKRARALQLSNAEVDYLHNITRQHMRIHHLAQQGAAPSRRAVYHFFRDAAGIGSDLCLLSLADTLATYPPSLLGDALAKELEVCQVLLESLWMKPTESVQPAMLVDGNDLMAELGLPPGPVIGRLLERLREAQAEGRLATRSEALAFCRVFLAEDGQNLGIADTCTAPNAVRCKCEHG